MGRRWSQVKRDRRKRYLELNRQKKQGQHPGQIWTEEKAFAPWWSGASIRARCFASRTSQFSSARGSRRRREGNPRMENSLCERNTRQGSRSPSAQALALSRRPMVGMEVRHQARQVPLERRALLALRALPRDGRLPHLPLGGLGNRLRA